jgi:hypothetical protein
MVLFGGEMKNAWQANQEQDTVFTGEAIVMARPSACQAPAGLRLLPMVLPTPLCDWGSSPLPSA